jgi:signal transduction histidine kinase
VRLRTQFGGADSGRWLVILCLLLGILAPTAAVLWFMNGALNSQKELTRRELDQAYADALTTQRKLFTERANAYWKDRVAAIERKSGDHSAASTFELAVHSGEADSVIVLTREGALAYPSPNATPAADSLDQSKGWIEARRLENSAGTLADAAAAYGRLAAAAEDPESAARALQAQIRCLVRKSDKPAALHLIAGNFRGGRLMAATDLQGRSIAADAQLLALHLDPKDRVAAALLDRLVTDYTNGLPSSQRLFLMNQLRELGPQTLPTYEAESLAAQYLESESGTLHEDGERGLRATRLPGVWSVASVNGQIIALFRTPTVEAAARGLTEGSRVQVAALTQMPPGEPPDWQITIPSMTAAQIGLMSPTTFTSHRQMVSYLWVGLLAISVMTVTTLIAAQALRRQWRLARMKTDLVAAVSHELKTPLASVRLLVDSLLEDDKPDAQRTHEYLELIARENLRLSGVIENFLTFSRLERNRQKFEFNATHPDAVVQSAVEAAHERLHAPDCRLDVNVSPNLPPVRADESALVTVLLNLLDNAWKYSPGEKHIAVRAYRENSRVVFAVEDNGIGIAPREQKKIFRRFYQVDRRLARDAGGCGLGLSIVEFIVRAHGGSIVVKSQPGHGSTFSVAIPEAA